jgi:hypothetical protein
MVLATKNGTSGNGTRDTSHSDETTLEQRFSDNIGLMNEGRISWLRTCPDVPSYIINDSAEEGFERAVIGYDPHKGTLGTYSNAVLNRGINDVVKKYRKRRDKEGGIGAEHLDVLFADKDDSTTREDVEFGRYLLSFAERPGFFDERESQVFRHYFGFNVGPSYDLVQIGRIMGIGSTVVQYIKNSLITKLLSAAQSETKNPEMKRMVSTILCERKKKIKEFK